MDHFDQNTCSNKDAVAQSVTDKKRTPILKYPYSVFELNSDNCMPTKKHKEKYSFDIGDFNIVTNNAISQSDNGIVRRQLTNYSIDACEQEKIDCTREILAVTNQTEEVGKAVVALIESNNCGNAIAKTGTEPNDVIYTDTCKENKVFFGPQKFNVLSEILSPLADDNTVCRNTSQMTLHYDSDSSNHNTKQKRVKHESTVGVLVDKLRNSLSEGALSDDCFLIKRKRKRTRKHKPKLKDLHLEASIVLEDAEHKPEMPTISPSLHIRFENDDETMSETTINICSNESQHIFQNKKTCLETSSVTGESCINVSNLIEHNALKEEDFLKYPIMANTVPRKADVIAFKVSIFV